MTAKKANTNKCARGFQHVWLPLIKLTNQSSTHNVYWCPICRGKRWVGKTWNDEDKAKLSVKQTRASIIAAEKDEG